MCPSPSKSSSATPNDGAIWANVWTTSNPGTEVDFSGSPKDHNPTGVAGAANTFARAAEVDGTIDISELTQGSIYFMHGTFINDWTLTVTMSAPGQPDIVATDTQGGNGPGTNFGWVTEFSFSDAVDYVTITYNYTNGDRDGSRARFMGVILDGGAEANPDDIDGDFLLDLWEDEFFGNNNGIIFRQTTRSHIL